jgi:D-alanyl-D-alanine carboxypeptidase (penicillin-binding protein 5/6)
LFFFTCLIALANSIESSSLCSGYTDEAGLCLASLAQVGNQEYVLVTAGAKGDNKYEQYHITDALAVYNSLIKQHS